MQPTRSIREQDLHEVVAANIRGEMAAQKRSNNELAAYLSISVSAAAKRLGGKQPFSLNETARVARWLGVPVSALFASRSTAEAAVA